MRTTTGKKALEDGVEDGVEDGGVRGEEVVIALGEGGDFGGKFIY